MVCSSCLAALVARFMTTIKKKGYIKVSQLHKGEKFWFATHNVIFITIMLGK